MRLHVLALGVFVWGAVAASALARDEAVPTYTNAQVVSIDPAKRTIVIKNTQGAQERLELEDGVAAPGDIKPGDHVILTLRGDPARPRVTAVTKSVTTPPSKVAAVSVSRPPLPPEDVEGPRRAFESQVASLAQQATRVDGLWSQYVNACDVKVDTRYEGGREWFSLWDGTASADFSNGFCRDLYNQILGVGEVVKRGMSGAEDVARKALEPGDIREIRERYAMNWDGWDRSAPARQTP
jgi:hypothetical protein